MRTGNDIFQLRINEHTTSVDLQHLICFIANQDTLAAGATVSICWRGGTDVHCIERQGIFLHRAYEVWAGFWYLPRPTPTKRYTHLRMDAYKMNRESYFDRRSHSSSLLQALSISRAYAFPSNLRSELCKTNCGVLALFQYICPAQYVVVETVLFLYHVRCTEPQLNRQHVRSFLTSHLPPCMLAGQRST